MYTANIISKELKNGKLKVSIQYTNEEESFVETMETRSKQDEDWLERDISRRLKELEELIIFSETIVIGEFKTNKKNKEKKEKTEKELYKEKLLLFENAQTAQRKGIITEENESFLELLEWLNKNFKSEYLNLFIG
jgi:hypothetical protein